MHLALFAYCLYATIVQVPRGVTKMENKDNELIERAKNFHGKFDPLAVHNKLYYQELQGCYHAACSGTNDDESG
jgi:hypothetical protein